VAKFRADVDEPRYYPDLGLSVAPGDVVELPADTLATGLTVLESVKVKKSVDPLPADNAEPAQGE